MFVHGKRAPRSLSTPPQQFRASLVIIKAARPREASDPVYVRNPRLPSPGARTNPPWIITSNRQSAPYPFLYIHYSWKTCNQGAAVGQYTTRSTIPTQTSTGPTPARRSPYFHCLTLPSQTSSLSATPDRSHFPPTRQRQHHLQAPGSIDPNPPLQMGGIISPPFPLAIPPSLSPPPISNPNLRLHGLGGLRAFGSF